MLTIKIAALTSSLTIFVYLLNDMMDADLDALNPIKSGRPIPTGEATKYQALQLSIIGGIVGIIIAYMINVSVLIFSLLYMILGFMYSSPPFNLKKRVIMKEVTPVLGFFLATSISALALGPINPAIYYISLYWALFVFTLSSTFYDALDVKGDERYGCKTIAMLLDQKKRLEFSVFGLIFMMVTSPLSYTHFGFNIISPILVCVACLLFLRFIYPLILEVEKVELKHIIKGSKIMQIFLLVMLFAFILGSF